MSVLSLVSHGKKNSKGRLLRHLLRHHGPERRFVCSGTKQLRTTMSIHQCDVFRGRREANYLRRSAQLIRSSVGPLSCTRRLNIDDEFRLLLSGSGPCFISKPVRCGALPVRRVGEMYYDKDFVDVLLRSLLQTGSRTQMALHTVISNYVFPCWVTCGQ